VVDGAACVISKAAGWDGAGDPINGEKKRSGYIMIIQGDLSTGERLVGTRTQTEHLKSLNNLLIPGLFHTQIGLCSMIHRMRDLDLVERIRAI
jgi:hypothetical protein